MISPPNNNNGTVIVHFWNKKKGQKNIYKFFQIRTNVRINFVLNSIYNDTEKVIFLQQ